MFTQRKMFSSSFVSSATSGVDTRTSVVADAAVELDGAIPARLGQPADDLRGVAQRVVGAAGIDALGRERDVEVAPGAEPGLLEQRDELLARRARVGRGLEHDELAAPAARSPTARLESSSGPRSGSRFGVSGVGDGDDDRLGLGEVGVARRRPDEPVDAAAGGRTGCPRCRSRRCAMAATLRWSRSSPTTSWPASAKATASGRPT